MTPLTKTQLESRIYSLECGIRVLSREINERRKSQSQKKQQLIELKKQLRRAA